MRQPHDITVDTVSFDRQLLTERNLCDTEKKTVMRYVLSAPFQRFMGICAKYNFFYY